MIVQEPKIKPVEQIQDQPLLALRPRFYTGLLAFILLYVGAADLYRASQKAFWFDEICTIAITAQNTPARIWQALQAAADTNPPAFYLIESIAHHIVANERIAYRLPSLVALLITVYALFLLGRRIAGPIAGISAALFPLMLPLRDVYGIEARPYAMLTAALALAILAWQDVERRGRAVLLALLLTLATALHYYAIYSLLPFVFAELVIVWQQRRIRYRVWLAFACCLIPLVISLPLAASLKRYYGGHFWASPSVGDIPFLWESLLYTKEMWGVGIVFALIGGVFFAHRFWSGDAATRRPLALSETVLLAGLLSLPVVGFIGAKLTHGGLTGRYVMPFTLGFALAVVYVVSTMGRRASLALVVVLATVFSVHELRYWSKQRVRQAVAPNATAESMDDLLAAVPHPDVPVVISHGVQYLPMSYSRLNTTGKSPIYAVTDTAAALKYIRTDSVDLALTVLSRYLPLRVEEFSQFRREHDRFLLYTADEGIWNWWPRYLVDEHYSLRLLGVGRDGLLYLAEAPLVSK